MAPVPRNSLLKVEDQLRLANSLKLLAVVFCLAAAGCASLSGAWTRADGRKVDLNQLSIDRTVCEDEVKANLTTSNQTTIWGPTEDARTVYARCMVRLGYTALE
jgi:hypothetical protein